MFPLNIERISIETKEEYNIRKRKERWLRQDDKQWTVISTLGGKCSSCNLEATKSTMVMFDFHHTNPEDKEENVAELLATGRPLKVVLEEADKCILLCANCHRQLHYNEHLKERQRVLGDSLSDVG